MIYFVTVVVAVTRWKKGSVSIHFPLPIPWCVSELTLALVCNLVWVQSTGTVISECMCALLKQQHLAVLAHYRGNPSMSSF